MRGADHRAIWVLLGPHKGDNNQVLALADGLGVPYRAIQMRYRRHAHLHAVARMVTISHLEGESRAEIAPPWPSLVLGIGQRSVPVARFIQRQSNGRAKVVRLGDPMVSPRLFDLVITTTQYPVRDAANVIRLPITITNSCDIATDELEEAWLAPFERPRRLVIIGGKTSLWRFGPEVIETATAALLRRARHEGGSVIAVTSPRTAPELIAAAQDSLGVDAVVPGPFPRYGALLNGADEIHVTGDSVSMLSDAVASGKPVGIIPLEPDLVGKLAQCFGELRGSRPQIRDLEKFWADLRARGLAGTLDEPRCRALELSPLDVAKKAVWAVLNQPQSAPLPKPASVLRAPSPLTL